MTEIATIDWFGRCGTSVFSENTAIFHHTLSNTCFRGEKPGITVMGFSTK